MTIYENFYSDNDIHVSSKHYEANDYGHNWNMLNVSHKLCVFGIL
jgi:hypothetical protein